MNCECKSLIEKKLMDRFIQTAPDATGHNVELQGYGFALTDSGMHVMACTSYKATATHPLKKGGTKAKTITGTMSFNFCPFCGVKA